MKPLVVVVGLTYDDARQYVLKHRETRPLLEGARILSSGSHPSRAMGLDIARVHETPAAFLGTHYVPLMDHLRRCAGRHSTPLT